MSELNRYQEACKSQGFDIDHISDSPIDNPKGWVDGTVHQTGGYIMVRMWFLGNWYTSRDEKDGEYQYECAYGENKHVSINRYKWVEGDGYMFDDTVRDERPEENTDEAKAQLAKEMMEEFEKDE